MCKSEVPHKAFSPKASPDLRLRRGGVPSRAKPRGGRPCGYDVRSVARTGGRQREAPEGCSAPLTAGSPPPPTMVCGEALGGKGGSLWVP
jgi:hypothetical protein